MPYCGPVPAAPVPAAPAGGRCGRSRSGRTSATLTIRSAVRTDRASFALAHHPIDRPAAEPPIPPVRHRPRRGRQGRRHAISDGASHTQDRTHPRAAARGWGLGRACCVRSIRFGRGGHRRRDPLKRAAPAGFCAMKKPAVARGDHRWGFGAGCRDADSADEQHFLIGRQGPEVVGDEHLQRIDRLAEGVHHGQDFVPDHVAVLLRRLD